jgi:predicted amidohydrolase YtcJ
MKFILAIILVAATAAIGCTASESEPVVAADMILYNGKIVTVNREFDIENAIAINGENILAVGKDDTIRTLVGPDTRMIDLQGKTVIPGLIDGHYHFMNKAVTFNLGVDVVLIDSIEEMVQRIGEKVAQTPPGELVYTTSGWMPQQLKENRVPTREDLDPVSPNNPVIVYGGHSIHLNTYALRQAGITRDTASPEGGKVEMDPETGEPTGRLIDIAKKLAWKKWTIGAATHEQKLQAIKASQKIMNAAGITSVREAAVTTAEMRIFQELRDKDELTVRVSMNNTLDSSKLDSSRPADQLIEQLEAWGVSTGFGDSMLRLDGVGEIEIDGGFESGLMSEPYAHAPGNEDPEEYFGLQLMPTEKFEKVLQAISRLGWRANTHAVGDRGLDITLDAYEKVNQIEPIAPKRWVIEHAHYTRPDQFKRIKDLGAVISTQFHPYMGAQNTVYFWGEERSSKTMRMRDWLDAGLIVGGGSDWGLMPANPFWMIYFWVTRDTRLGGLSGPDQKISREEALRVMTINNAYITFEEDVKGSLEPGKLADLLVLSDDILTVPDAQIKEITPLLTLLGGKVVHQTNGAFAVN